MKKRRRTNNKIFKRNIGLRFWPVSFAGLALGYDAKRIYGMANEIEKIWGGHLKKLGYDIQPSKILGPQTLNIGKLTEQRKQYEDDILPVLAKLINPEVVVTPDLKKQIIDVILLPRFGPWGRAFNNLIADPNLGNPSKPFFGPTAVVTVNEAVEDKTNKIVTRSSQYLYANGVSDVVKDEGTIIDICHEIGHIFGLPHTNNDKKNRDLFNNKNINYKFDGKKDVRVQCAPITGLYNYLMYTSLYVPLMKKVVNNKEVTAEQLNEVKKKKMELKNQKKVPIRVKILIAF